MALEEYSIVRAERLAVLRDEIALALPKGTTGFVWEIGCGHGHFLNAFAQTNANQRFVGVDRCLERIERSEKKCTRAKLENLAFIRCEADDFLNEIPAGVVIEDVYLLFPDPWPKKRHHKHRLVKPEFLDRVADRAGEGCRFFFRSDFHPYYAEAAEIFGTHPRWELLAPGPFPFEYETVFHARANEAYSLSARVVK